MDVKKLHDVIFEADTPNGKLFDIILLIAILLSVGVVMLESVPEISLEFTRSLRIAEYVFTVLFTIEYVLRLIAVKKKMKYALSFYGIVDLLSILPTFIEFLLPGVGSIRVIRVFRLLRVFRVLKLVGFLREAGILRMALWESRRKILVFMGTVLVLVTIMGTMVYLVEDSSSGFTSIPRSIYWAIVTVTTVGYGDIAPVTVIGQTLASIIMLIGYAIIAVPTGIIGAEIIKSSNTNTKACSNCNYSTHEDGAGYCNRCGELL
ncbi:MAG: ion transporter [Flavobacteriales bacterium]|jgi:voltage-gated potassium channel|nr:ion transporter [Flavobacteriales bacterium]